MKISTVRVRNKRTGKTMVVNAENYLAMQHTSGDWELVSEQFVNKTEVPATVIIEPTEPANVEGTVDSDSDLSGSEEKAGEETDNEEESDGSQADAEEESGEKEEGIPKVKVRRGRKAKEE